MSWRQLLMEELVRQRESWEDVISCTLPMEQLSAVGILLKTFTAWTEKRVYFSTVYDGYGSVKSVLRNPRVLSQRRKDDLAEVIDD